MTSVEEIMKVAHGVISKEEARATGLTQRQIRYKVLSGVWMEVFPGTYVSGSVSVGPLQRAAAAMKWGGDESLLCGVSAAFLYGLGTPFAADLVSTKCLRHPSANVHRRVSIAQRHRRVQGLRVVRVEDALICIADRRPASLQDAMDGALLKSLTTFERLVAPAGEGRARRARGARRFEEALRRMNERALVDSDLEADFLRLLTSSGLPLPATQERIETGGGVARVDFIYPAASLVIELDGYLYHWRRKDWSHDVTRGNALQIKGLRILRYTFYDVRDRPAEIVSEVAEAIGFRLNRH